MGSWSDGGARAFGGMVRTLKVCMGRVFCARIPGFCRGSLVRVGFFDMMWSVAMVGVQSRSKEGEVSTCSQLVSAYRTSVLHQLDFYGIGKDFCLL